MATASDPSLRLSYVQDQSFFFRLAVGVSLVTIVSFLQIAARGLTDPLTAPIAVHIHALLMVGWLGLFVVQNYLAVSDVRLHKRLGIVGIALAAAIVSMGLFVSVEVIELHRLGSTFTGSLILANDITQAGLFAALVSTALIMRSNPEYHRRFMFAATIAICGGPAMGRWLPDSMAGDARSMWLYLAIDLGALFLIARHDHRTRGSVHSATLWSAVAVSLGYSMGFAASYNPGLIAFAERLFVQGSVY